VAGDSEGLEKDARGQDCSGGMGWPGHRWSVESKVAIGIAIDWPETGFERNGLDLRAVEQEMDWLELGLASMGGERWDWPRVECEWLGSGEHVIRGDWIRLEGRK